MKYLEIKRKYLPVIEWINGEGITMDFVGGTVKALNENTLYFVAVVAAAMIFSIVTKNKRRRR